VFSLEDLEVGVIAWKALLRHGNHLKELHKVVKAGIRQLDRVVGAPFVGLDKYRSRGFYDFYEHFWKNQAATTLLKKHLKLM